MSSNDTVREIKLSGNDDRCCVDKSRGSVSLSLAPVAHATSYNILNVDPTHVCARYCSLLPYLRFLFLSSVYAFWHRSVMNISLCGHCRHLHRFVGINTSWRYQYCRLVTVPRVWAAEIFGESENCGSNINGNIPLRLQILKHCIVLYIKQVVTVDVRVKGEFFSV